MSLTELPITVCTDVEPQPLPPSPYAFGEMEPDEQGLVGHGADFEPPTIVAAYRAGCFPWPHPSYERLWFSPDPRAILPVGGLHVSRRLARTARAGGFRVTVDAAFGEVIRSCSLNRPEGSWITPSLTAAYARLHELGWAHSVEAWTVGGALAGGLYGVAVGGLFAGESMFSAVPDASKVALVGLVAMLREDGGNDRLLDVQWRTDHLATLGVVEVPRTEYLGLLRRALDRPLPARLQSG